MRGAQRQDRLRMHLYSIIQVTPKTLDLTHQVARMRIVLEIYHRLLLLS
jgi:hypothetical protein